MSDCRSPSEKSSRRRRSRSSTGRAELIGLTSTRDAAGRVTAGFAEVELKDGFGGEAMRPYVFAGIGRPLFDSKVYTLDPCPNDWYGYWLFQVVNGLCSGQPNVLYNRLAQPPAHGDGEGLPGQKKFLKGLEAFQKTGLLHDFEESKREFIGRHGKTPMLLVQGPPGTGKSYSTAFAVFARLQAAMKENRPYRVFLTCKTHAATDVLLKNVLDVQENSGGFRPTIRNCSPSTSTNASSPSRSTGSPRTNRLRPA